MSLTGIIKQRPDCYMTFLSALESVGITKSSYVTTGDGRIKVPYRLKNFKDAALVGTAFDYGARFIIASKLTCPNAIDNATSHIVAEHGLDLLRIRSCNITDEDKDKIEDFFDKGISLIRKYIDDNSLDLTFIRICVFLAKLEQIYRSGKVSSKEYYLSLPSENIVEEVKMLLNSFIDYFMPLVKKDSKVVFNPNFREASAYVRGADADVLIDGVLYDFKTSKYSNYKHEETLQMLGYYFLNSYENIYNIKKLSLFKVRFGTFETLNINSIDCTLLQETKKTICEEIDK